MTELNHKNEPDKNQLKSGRQKLKRLLSVSNQQGKSDLAHQPLAEPADGSTARSGKTKKAGIDIACGMQNSDKKSPQSDKNKIHKNALREWLLIIVGAILVMVAVFNLVNFNPVELIVNLRVTPAVDQAGFAPVFMPKPSGEDSGLPAQSSTVEIPERLMIPKIGLDAPVEIAESVNVTIDDREVIQFLVPEEFAAGWHEGSAPLGVPGNTVISGHHNAFGKVFELLVKLDVGDSISLSSGNKIYSYVIANKLILPERDQPLEVRLENGRWILPSSDERVTLVTCWPELSNTHRLIIVAVPVGSETVNIELNYEEKEPEPALLSTPAALFLKANTPSPQPTPSTRLTTPAAALLTSATLTPGSVNMNFTVRNAGRSTVNIRSLPSMQGEILGAFKAGDEAAGLGRTADGTWIYISYKEVLGWVDAELVQILTQVEFLPTIITPNSAP